MSNLQNTLDALQPYVIGIRYLKGIPLVDVVLTDGWTVPEDPLIKKVKGDESLNYHMIFSEEPSIGLDELLTYVDKTIKLNLDREKKHDLLKTKVFELKELFKKNSLAKLQRLKFSFNDDDEFTTSMTDIDMDEKLSQNSSSHQATQPTDAPIEEDIIEEPSSITYLDENKQPIELTDEDREVLEEEARAERNRKIQENLKQKQSAIPITKKIELPPKRKMEMVTTERDFESDCDCGPNDACEKCIDKKDY